MSKTLIARCPDCTKAHRAPVDYVGKKIRCQGCKIAFRVESETPQVDDEGGNPYAAEPSPPRRAVQGREAQVSETAINHLVGTAPWVRVIAIMYVLGFIVSVVFGLLALLMGPPGAVGATASTSTSTRVLILLLSAGFYLAFAWPLSSYASSISRLKESGESRDLESALKYQRIFWTITGVGALLGLLLVAAVFVAFSLWQVS